MRHSNKGRLGIFVFERVQQGHTALKALLVLIRAGDWEMDTPVSLRSQGIRVVVWYVRLTRDRGWEAQKRQQEPSRWILHSTPPSSER